jgi:methylglyoxal synthase
MVAEGGIRDDSFFLDPLSAHPHDPDIRAVMRVCKVHNVAVATNVAGADLFLASPLLRVGVPGVSVPRPG